MQPYTLTVRLGTVDENASSSTAYPNLRSAMAAAGATVERDWGSPVLSILVQAGDHAPRVRNGAWVDAPAGGWPV